MESSLHILLLEIHYWYKDHFCQNNPGTLLCYKRKCSFITVVDYFVTDSSCTLDKCSQYVLKSECELRPLVKDHYATITLWKCPTCFLSGCGLQYRPSLLGTFTSNTSLSADENWGSNKWSRSYDFNPARDVFPPAGSSHQGPGAQR